MGKCPSKGLESRSPKLAEILEKDALSVSSLVSAEKFVTNLGFEQGLFAVRLGIDGDVVWYNN